MSNPPAVVSPENRSAGPLSLARLFLSFGPASIGPARDMHNNPVKRELISEAARPTVVKLAVLRSGTFLNSGVASHALRPIIRNNFRRINRIAEARSSEWSSFRD